MVEILRSPSLGKNMGGSGDMMEIANRLSNLAVISETEKWEAEEQGQERGVFKKPTFQYNRPRRAFSSNDYRIPSAPSTPKTPSQILATPSLSPISKGSEPDSYFQLGRNPKALTSKPFTPISPTQNSFEVSSSVPPGHVPPARRPALPSPQRSYSVMDYVPVPFTHLPGETIQLPNLPPEIHFTIFDFLDPIDSTCLGLTSKHFYSIHRRMHGTIPLTARRVGPNDMEWAWRLAGPLIAAGATREDAMAKLLPKGQVYCVKCGIFRCELHRHLQDWFGQRFEYCEVRQKFGPKSEGSSAKRGCFRSSPRHPHRCGKHTRQQRAVRLV